MIWLYIKWRHNTLNMTVLEQTSNTYYQRLTHNDSRLLRMDRNVQYFVWYNTVTHSILSYISL